jgi:hypothetical protein
VIVRYIKKKVYLEAKQEPSRHRTPILGDEGIEALLLGYFIEKHYPISSIGPIIFFKRNYSSILNNENM